MVALKWCWRKMFLNGGSTYKETSHGGKWG